jgi:hypothetical protein
MSSAELIIELPAEEADFLQAYAKEHGTTVASLMARYAQALRNASRRPPHPANVQFTGTIPSEVDARETYLQHMVKKHR